VQLYLPSTLATAAQADVCVLEIELEPEF